MSTGLPSRSDINNLNNLDYSKPYQDFDYSKYINEIKLSNFAHAGGSSSSKTKSQKSTKKSINKVMKHMYMDYVGGRSSFMQGGTTRQILMEFTGACSQKGGADLPIQVQDTLNVSNLGYKQCYNPPRVSHISNVPYSSFQM